MAKKTKAKKAKATKAKAKNKPKAKSASPTARSWRNDPRVVAIVAECKNRVLQGAGGKTFDPPAETAVENFFGPKIKTRKDQRDDWDSRDPSGGYVKDKPLLVATHLGQICAILAKGNVITKKVGMVAAAAVQKDENCITAQGAGDWCA